MKRPTAPSQQEEAQAERSLAQLPDRAKSLNILSRTVSAAGSSTVYKEFMLEPETGGGHGEPPLQAVWHYISASPGKETPFLTPCRP